MCYRSYLSEEAHSWIQECLRAVGSGSVSYFCRRVEKYVFDYKLQKRKSFWETDLHCRHVARVCRAGRSGRVVGVQDPTLYKPLWEWRKGISHTWSELHSLWVVSFTAVHNLNMRVSFMSCLWWKIA